MNRVLFYLALVMVAVQVMRLAKNPAWRPVWMLAFWILIAAYTQTRHPALGIPIFIAMVLAFFSKCASGGNLRVLSAEEQAFRDGLNEEDRLYLQIAEMAARKRLTIEEGSRRLEEHRTKVASAQSSPPPNGALPVRAGEDPGWNAVTSLERGAVQFRLLESIAVPTSSGETLSLPAGEYQGTLALRADTQEEEPEKESQVECIFTFEHGGRQWSSRSRLWLSRGLSPEEEGFGEGTVSWIDAPQEWKEAFANRCLLAGAWLMSDSRLRFPIRIGSRSHVIHTKYLMWRADLALAADGCGFFVRMRGLHAEDDDSAEPIPPFCKPIAIERLLPLTAPTLHDGLATEMDDEEENQSLV